MEALTGRGEGPKFALRCAMEEEVAGAKKTSAVSRAWRRSAGWLSDILRTRNMVEAKWCKRKVVAYQHPPPDRFKAIPQQMESFAKFKSWQDAVSEPLLGNRTWVLALRDMAVANAEKEERAAAAGWTSTERSTGAVTDVDARAEQPRHQRLEVPAS